MAISSTTANPFMTFGSPTILDDIFFGSGGTVCIWMNPQTFGGRNRILSKAGADSRDGWQMYINLANDVFGNANSAAFLVSAVPNNTDRGAWSTPTSSITTNTWYHYAVTFNATSVANVPSLYLNGVIQTLTTKSTGGGTYNSDAANTLTCLQNDGSAIAGADFNGWAEDLRMYNRILNAAEIATIHTARGTDNIISGLVGRWPMIGPDLINPLVDTSSAVDVSGNGNHGTATTFLQAVGGVIRTTRGFQGG